MIAVYESGRYRDGHGKTRQSGHGCKKSTETMERVDKEVP